MNQIPARSATPTVPPVGKIQPGKIRTFALKRFAAAALLAAVAGASPVVVFAQVDAAAAYAQGKEAFQKGDYDKARDAFVKASQTDTKNPEVFLWLGKAQYELGAIDDAIAAWKTTIALAPNEPTAGQMLKVLTGRGQSADTSIKLLETLIGSDFFDRAVDVASRLLADKALTDSQRSRVMLLEATTLLELNRVPEAASLVDEAILKFPAQVDANEATLLLARGRVKIGGARLSEGVAALRKLVTDQPNTPSGIAAQYELLAFDIDQQVDFTKADALAQWVVAHPEHPLTMKARRKVIDAYLQVTVLSGEPATAAALSPTDKAAISFAAQEFGRLASSGEARKLTDQLIAHFDSFYAANKAYVAAANGVDALLAIKELPASSRSIALRASARYRSELALKELGDSVAAGVVPAGVIPKSLADAVAVYGAITREFPSTPAWREQASLAERVRAAGANLPWPSKIVDVKPIYPWAAEIALPVVKSSTDVVAVGTAVATITAIVNETAGVEQPGARGLALKLNTSLLSVIPADNSNLAAIVMTQASLLDTAAAIEFRENIRTGKPELNSKLSNTQNVLIDLMARIVAREARLAPIVVDRLNAHLQPWMASGQYAVVEAAYARLTAALPADQQRRMQLVTVRLWIQQAVLEQQRLAAAGLDEPRKLNENLLRAARRLYELQAGLGEADPFLGEVRGTLDSIVNHYKSIQYFDIAEEVVKAKGEPANPNADAYAQFQLARLQDEAARRELTATLKNYKAAEKLTLLPAAKAAIAAYEQFITDHPTDPLAVAAAQSLFAVAQLYEDYSAHDVAASIYTDLAAFGAKTKTLAFAVPGQSSFTERADFAVAGAADIKARQAFAKVVAANKGKAVPLTKISDEFAAALKVYRAFIVARPQSPLVGAAIQRINAIALDYARSDAWDVADAIYGSLLQGELKIREPARVEFCRGMCQIGKVMPEHAKEVLAALLAPVGSRSEGEGDRDMARVMDDQRRLGVMTDKDGFKLTDSPATQPGGFVTGGGLVLSGKPGEKSDPNFAGLDGTMNGGRGGGGGGGIHGIATPVTASPAPRSDSDFVAPPGASAASDREALAAISRQEARRAQQIAALREPEKTRAARGPQQQAMNKQAIRQGQQDELQTAQLERAGGLPVISEDELNRQQAALDAAYLIFQSIKTRTPETATADQARGEIMISIDYWRGINQPQRAAALAERYLKDNPVDSHLPNLRLAIALDHLAWASQPLDKLTTSQEMLTEVGKRFETARTGLAAIVTTFPDEIPLVQQAQWQIATSFLTQARVVDVFSPVLARGQYVRAATELQRVANRYAEHPQMAQVPQMLWEIAEELNSRSYFEEAINVWNDLSINHATHQLAGQAKVRIAQCYQSNLGRPLRAAEIYLEINFARGGGDLDMQNAVFNIGSQLTQQKRWVESLHVLQVFVDSFPRHQNAGPALAMIGQIHQSNEAWQDAIAAYQRVIEEYPGAGQSLQEAKWAIAECVINLSQWKPAVEAYQGFVAAFPKDGRVAEANRRIGILKDLGNFQTLVNEKGPKAFDAQFQMASIIEKQLTLQPKAIVEYQKVAMNYPKSHLADDALYAVGLIYRGRGEIDMARAAWRETASKYPDSPLADDALYQIGKSFEDEAQQLAGLTQAGTLTSNNEVAQNRAYQWAQKNLSEQRANQVQKLMRAKGNNKKEAELQEASNANLNGAFDSANAYAAVEKASQDVQSLTAAQLADRQDKINASLRKAVAAYDESAKVPGADKAGESLLRMAVIYNDRLGDGQAAMKTWLEIVRQFSGTAVAEEASWQIAAQYERAGQYTEAVESYKAFLRNYRRSPKASEAQFFIAENYEHLNQWVFAMDQYSNYLNNFPDGPLAQKAREQINFIKTYRL